MSYNLIFFFIFFLKDIIIDAYSIAKSKYLRKIEDKKKRRLAKLFDSTDKRNINTCVNKLDKWAQ